MPSYRFEWHQRITNVAHEYRSARTAVDRYRSDLVATPDLMGGDPEALKYLRSAHDNREGTYLVRLFATFEAALRSYDRAKHNDPNCSSRASILIDTIGGRRGRGIQTIIRQKVHEVRQVRNYWAHESDDKPYPMTIDEARKRLQFYLRELEDEW